MAFWKESEELRADAETERQKANGHNRTHFRRSVRLVRFSEMRPRLDNDYVVKRVLNAEQISLLFGPPKIGKSFWALDLGLHVANGIEWLGHRVKPGSVVYIAAEAGGTIENRVSAWKIDKRRTKDDLPFAVVPHHLDFCHGPEDVDALIEAIRDTDLADDLRLIVVDTLSRVMSGGNENSPDDMGAIIAAVDRLRDEFCCHVLLIHHVGKDASRGARGHSSLMAAVDTMIQVTRAEGSKVSIATVDWQRDGEEGEQIHFELGIVSLGDDQDGEQVTSCVVRPADQIDVSVATERAKDAKMPKSERVALKALDEVIKEAGEIPPANSNIPPNTKCTTMNAWRERCYRLGISAGESTRAQRAAFTRAFDALLEKRVAVCDGWVWVKVQ